MKGNQRIEWNPGGNFRVEILCNFLDFNALYFERCSEMFVRIDWHKNEGELPWIAAQSVGHSAAIGRSARVQARAVVRGLARLHGTRKAPLLSNENKTKKQTPWPLVRERTIPTDRPPLVDEI
jgi:hypothetical protein